jgi:cytochrome c556
MKPTYQFFGGMSGAFQIALVAAPLVISPTSVAFADDKDVIEYRVHIMNTLNEQTLALGLILSSAIPPDNTAAHLEAISLTAKTAVKAFEPKVQGGQSKPEVWTQWPDFSKRMSEFVQKTDAVAKVAREKGNDAAQAIMMEALSCKSCHDLYRDEKRK